MKTSDYLAFGAVAFGGYLLYKSFYGGTSREEAIRSFTSSGGKVNTNLPYNPGSISVTYDQLEPGKTTTYFFSPEEYGRYNWAQQLLNQVGFIPKNWIFGV